MLFPACCLVILASLDFAGSTFGTNKETFRITGTIGKPLLLKPGVPPSNFSSLLLKSMPNIHSRQKLICYNAATSQKTVYNSSLGDKYYGFNKSKGCFEIISMRKEDEGSYELVIAKGPVEIIYYLQVEVYEQISNISIQLTQHPQNNSCIIILNCTVQRGDGVSYSWSQDQKTLSYNSSVLQITQTTDNNSSVYTCRAHNPVSKESTDIKPWVGCNVTPAQSKQFPVVILVSTSVVVLCIILLCIIIKCYSRKKGKHIMECQDDVQAPEPTQPHISTIYTSVQKTEVREGPKSPTHASSTIYELAGQMFIQSNHSSLR
ncbi:signaling lymphocytic activation molecule-like [Discoglossus pictus]